MIDSAFADTNLFLRYLTNDIPDQAQAFEQLLVKAAQGEMRLVTNSLVIAEIVWTLESFYQLSPADTQSKILAILNTPGLEVAEADLLLQAITWHVEKKVDFIDAYNAAWMIAHGLTTIYTHDRKHLGRFDKLAVIVPRM
jgi:predicted nucleic acid-binding protein